jgi:hypothetical protein
MKMKMTSETLGETIARLGDDGVKWANEMSKYNLGCPDLLIPWTCNIIEIGRSKGRAEAEREMAGELNLLRSQVRTLRMTLIQVQGALSKYKMIDSAITEALDETDKEYQPK